MSTKTVSPGSGSVSSNTALGSLVSKLQGAGVDMSGGSAPDEETKKRLRELGISMKKGGKVSSASKRADGIAIRGKTRA